jgi:hypothetical protein
VSMNNSNFWNYTELEQLHIELTNGCNAACPMCVRFHRNSPLARPDLEIGQITLEKFQQYFPPEVLRKCRTILFCGVHGDAGTARDTLEIMQYISVSCAESKTAVRMISNGGMRKSQWWAELGKVFADNYKKDWGVTFSIDGLEDTNHLYRRNVKWPVLMDNVKAYISAGGRALWDFLIFKHNEHQLNEAERVCYELGFKEFRPKKALGVDNGTSLSILYAMNAQGQVDYAIEAPVNPKNRNLETPNGPTLDYANNFDPAEYWEAKDRRGEPVGNNGIDRFEQIPFSVEVGKVYDVIARSDYATFDSTEIACKSQTHTGGKEIFVDQAGRVMPCCYIGTHLNSKFFDPKTTQLHYHMNKYGWDNFDLNKHSLQEILEAGHLNRVWADSWSQPSVREGKMAFCANVCPKNQPSAVDKIFMHEKMKSKPPHIWQTANKKDV